MAAKPLQNVEKERRRNKSGCIICARNPQLKSDCWRLVLPRDPYQMDWFRKASNLILCYLRYHTVLSPHKLTLLLQSYCCHCFDGWRIKWCPAFNMLWIIPTFPVGSGWHVSSFTDSLFDEVTRFQPYLLWLSSFEELLPWIKLLRINSVAREVTSAIADTNSSIHT